MAELKEMVVNMIDNTFKKEGFDLTKEINVVANLVESEFNKEKKMEKKEEEEEPEKKEELCMNKSCHEKVPTIIIKQTGPSTDILEILDDIKLLLVVLIMLLLVLFIWKFSEHIKMVIQLIFAISTLTIMTDPLAYEKFFPQLN